MVARAAGAGKMASDAPATLPPASMLMASTSTSDTGLSTSKRPILTTRSASSTLAKQKKKEKLEKGHKTSSKGSKKSLKEYVTEGSSMPPQLTLQPALSIHSPKTLASVLLGDVSIPAIRQVNPPLSYPVSINSLPSLLASEPDDIILLYTPRRSRSPSRSSSPAQVNLDCLLVWIIDPDIPPVSIAVVSIVDVIHLLEAVSLHASHHSSFILLHSNGIYSTFMEPSLCLRQCLGLCRQGIRIMTAVPLHIIMPFQV
ncbi:UNVERIFIED_CONTAM: hypothetical protein K2H54_000974 [Gekko kuhli]